MINDIYKCKIVIDVKRMYYTKKVKKQCKSFIEPLKVNGKSRVNSNTILKKNVNFNGMIVKGNGNVKIGNNFHSGQDCLMITFFHKYDGGFYSL